MATSAPVVTVTLVAPTVAPAPMATVAVRCVASVTVMLLAVTPALPNATADTGSLRGFLFPGGAAGRTPGLASRGPRIAGRSIGPGPLFVGNRVTANGGTPAEWYAANAIDQVKIREIKLLPP